MCRIQTNPTATVISLYDLYHEERFKFTVSLLKEYPAQISGGA
jgi:hypothetical protein